MFKNTVSRFRLIAFVEGVSYLILLFIAMPMKYMYGIAGATKIVGMTHGILFLLFLYLLMEIRIKHNWSNLWVVIAFISSLVPFGTFFIDKKIKSTT